MTWTAAITGKAQDIGHVEFAVRYSDGVKTKDELLRAPDLQSLKRSVASRLASLESGDVAFAAVPLGAFDPTIAPPDPPIPADVAFDVWIRKFNRLRRVQELISLSVLTGLEAGVVSLRDDVKNTFLPSYINRF